MRDLLYAGAALAAAAAGCALHEPFGDMVGHMALTAATKVGAAKRATLGPHGEASDHYLGFSDVMRVLHGFLGPGEDAKDFADWAARYRAAQERIARFVAPLDVNHVAEVVQVPGSQEPGVFLDPCQGTYAGCGEGRPVMAYFPGSSFLGRSPMTAAGEAAAFARTANASVIVCGARSALSATLADMAADASACLDWAQKKAGGGGRVVAAGVGSGAALALGAAGGRAAAALWLVSPWADLGCAGLPADSADWALGAAWRAHCREIVSRLQSASASLAPSPAGAAALPPTLLTYGGAELLAGQQRKLGELLKANTPKAEVDEVKGVHHGFVAQVDYHSESSTALLAARKFFKTTIGVSPSS
eukprot:TRINITY_DN46975_c0_g1_i1.p1 TRINITY_DN46975_c0_g1~~TRINITY_DN46975_c0_g1_i1.p1  ORF type:complete len:392 (+),score=118.78 TRINITY_DN46975_c0_g1_i1:95-1177(+)